MSDVNSRSDRLSWLDTGRMMAAFFIIAHHSATDAFGTFFGDAEKTERIFPVLFRMTSELASTEFFFTISLFLLSLKLERRPLPYWATMRVQARRLLVPFLFWAVFYAFFRLVKAQQFGYEQQIWEQLGTWQNWVAYLTLGTSQYHMHFLPTLFLILLFHPILRIATSHPIAALAVVPMLAMRQHLDGMIWAHVDEPMMRDYLIRLVKIFAYTGYGLLAYGLYGIFKRKLDERTLNQMAGLAFVVVLMAYVVKLAYGMQIIETARFANRSGVDYWSHYLMPAGVMLIFIGSQNRSWPPAFDRWSRYSFGLYLIHPAVLDLIEIAIAGHGFSPTTYVLVKYIAASTLSLATSILIASFGPLAWTIGLGEIPLLERRSGATPTPSGGKMSSSAA